ncbi:alpha/beta fold hydrolase [Burkholderia gladioli]|uniref:alpha/beta fold hydrolase n=1 Tax=Burkholderia gladioli TaxID=28095 RepID=UPI000F800D16|nr:alpha/beta hydrolase [Burkholderia gladioli]MDN7811882.1 alpha/beta hydrolase [Burkholderia gladioli]
MFRPASRCLASRCLASRCLAALLAASACFAGPVAHADPVSYHYASVDGLRLFYREAGDRAKPTLLLLHGFPSSSHEFRDLMPLLAGQFHVIAPDYPGMGYSEAPPAERFAPSFDKLTSVIEHFVASLGEPHLIVYMTDFGGPVGMRLALHHPDWIDGLVFQNAVISEDGVDPARRRRDAAITGEATEAKRALAESHVSLATALLLYRHGAREPDALNPDAWTNDAAALANPDSRRIMTDLQLDIPNNVAAFPAWQAWLREHQPRTLVVWGRNDPIFVPAGAEAIRREVPDAAIHYYDTGHFALEEDHDDIARQIGGFFAPVHVRGRIESVEGATVTVRTREGATQVLKLDARTRLAAVKPYDRAQIEPGSYVGAAAVPSGAGLGALEVMVYREERRGTGEGHYAWDLAPGSSMTGATVTAVTAEPGGRDLDLRYGSETLRVHVPDSTPVVTYAPAGREDLVPGAYLFAVAAPGDHGQWRAGAISVEKDGVKPPL